MGDSTSPASQGAGLSPADDEDDSHWHEGQHDVSSKHASPVEGTPSAERPSKPFAHLQKRRRVTRACDECRRKKIKCDGKQPCTHCTVYSYECTYDQPSNRRRNPAPQYTEALESRLQKAEAILRAVLPGIDFDDPKYQARGIDQILESHSRKPAPAAGETAAQIEAEHDAQLQSMVESTGSLDIDDQGHYNFHGHSSGLAFVSRLSAQFGDFVPRVPDLHRSYDKGRSGSHLSHPPQTAGSPSSYDPHAPSSVELPPKDVARELCENTLREAISLLQFLHIPTFYKKLDRIYESDPDHFTAADIRFLALLYLVMAVGCLFESTDESAFKNGYEDAIDRGYHYFQAARHMLDITDCHDLTTLQTICLMIVFLQCTAKLSTCYSYLGIALRSSCRLGLHRHVVNEFNPIEREERKRTFWMIRRLDIYVGAILGLPNMLSDDDIDQELPIEVSDEYITENGIIPMPPDTFALMTACNAHVRLVRVLQRVVREIYPIKGFNVPEGKLPGDGYSISLSRIWEIEGDLQKWMDELPLELRSADSSEKHISKVQQLLRLCYAHVQMMLYRPFLHYVSQNCEAEGVDRRSFAYAAACVSVARNIVHIMSEMKRRDLLNGAHWFVMYTTYLAILVLIFFALENPDNPTGKEILRDATEGRDALANMAKRSMAADRCSRSLSGLFDNLPEKLEERKNSHPTSGASRSSRKRPQSSGGFMDTRVSHGSSIVPSSRDLAEVVRPAERARTFPSNISINVVNRHSMPENFSPTPQSLGDLPEHEGNPAGMWDPSNSATAIATPASSSTSSPQRYMGNPNLPDLNAVMFPSENPFAYGNQPSSMLESQQYLGSSHPGSVPSSLSSNLYDLGDGLGEPEIVHPFGNADVPMYNGELPLYMQQQQQGRQGSASIPGAEPFGPAQIVEDHGDPTGAQFPPAGGEGIWPLVDRGGEQGRNTCPTPGVNLDELFGGESWSSIWNHPTLGWQ